MRLPIPFSSLPLASAFPRKWRTWQDLGDPYFSFIIKWVKHTCVHTQPIIFRRFRQHIKAMGVQKSNSPKGGGQHRCGPGENCSEPETDYFYLEVSCIFRHKASYSQEYIYISLRSTDICYLFSQGTPKLLLWEEFSSELSLFSDKTLDEWLESQHTVGNKAIRLKKAF